MVNQIRRPPRSIKKRIYHKGQSINNPQRALINWYARYTIKKKVMVLDLYIKRPITNVPNPVATQRALEQVNQSDEELNLLYKNNNLSSQKPLEIRLIYPKWTTGLTTQSHYYFDVGHCKKACTNHLVTYNGRVCRRVKILLHYLDIRDNTPPIDVHKSISHCEDFTQIRYI